jgi:hypothetical protein
MNHSPAPDLEQQVWALFDKAISDALADDATPAAVEAGIRAAEVLLNARVVAPPTGDRISAPESLGGTEIPASALHTDPIVLEVGEDLAICRFGG